MIDRRRPLEAHFHHRRMLLLVTAFTWTIFPTTGKAVNSNPRHETVINNDDFDAPSVPEMAPIKEFSGENTGSFGVEGREELLRTPNILTPSIDATEGDQGDEDSLVADATAAEAAADTATAHSGDTAEASGLMSLQHSPTFPATGGEGDASTAAEGAALGTDYAPKEPVDIVEGSDNELEGISQEEVREKRDGNVRPDEETTEEAREEKLPTAYGDSEGTAGSGDIVVDGHPNTHEVPDLGTAKLGVPTAVTTDDGQVGSADSTTQSVDDSAETGGGGGASLSAENEDQHQQRLPPMPPTASDNGSSLVAQASAATMAAGATQVKDSAVTTTKPVDNHLEESGSSSRDGEGGVGAVDDDLESGTSYPSSIASATSGGRGPQKPGGPEPSTDSTPAASDVDGARPLRAEGSQGGRGDDDGHDGRSGVMNDDTTVNRTRADSKTGRRPKGAEEDTETPPSNRSSSSDGGSGSGSRWNEAGGHRRRDGDAGQGESGGAGGGGEGGRRDDDASSGVAGTDFTRGSPEELAQRVRDMEAELLRKLQAEEDAKSLLDIWVERAREYVLTQTVPPTDAECDFSWSRLRCEPKCLCGARLRFGDYTPGRACRLLHPWERNPELCGEAGADPWDPSDEPAFRRAAAAVAGALGGLRRAYEARVAPPSDPECHFSLETRRCEPQPLCRLRLRWGDISPTNGCRLVAVPEEKRPAAAAGDKHTGSPIL